MQISKMAKKIAAISTGALMLGATLTGALAASYKLADYPAPFLKDGVLDNTVIVVGKAAATSDVVGAIDLAAALQAEAVSQETVETGATAPTIDSGVKVEKSGIHYIFGRDIYDVQPSFDENDLDILEEGTFKDTKGENKGSETYKQDLTFSNGVGILTLTQPEDMKGGIYVEIPKNTEFYTYQLDFDSAIDYGTASTDLVGNTIKLQGNTYTITEVTESSDLITKMKLVAGDSTVWLLQDQPYTVGSHTVTIVNVDENGDSCGVNVDGTTMWIDNGSTEEINGLSVGVLDVKVVHSKDYDQDTCELSLGSNELILEDGEPVSVNGEDMEGSVVDISTGTNTWDGFTIVFTTGKMDTGVNSDDIHLAEGGAWTDPVFGNWKVVYSGTTADTETIRFESTGEDATLTFMNNDGKEVEVPYFYTGSAMMLGTDDDEHLLMPGDTTGTLTDVEGTMFLYSTPGGEVHILEMTDLTCASSNNKTTIRDLTYDTVLAKDQALDADCSAAVIEEIDLGSLGNMKLNLTATKITYVQEAGYGYDDIFSEYEGTFALTDSEVSFTEKDGDETSAAALIFNLTYDATDDEIVVNLESGYTGSLVNNDEDDDDVKWGRTAKGTLVKYDTDENLWIEYYHPEEDLFANVFIAPLKAEVTSGSEGGVTADKVNPFSVGLAVLDENAGSLSKNMIVVGGPAVNLIAFEIMGMPADPAEGFEPGKAMLKFYERSGKAALLVAGYDAQDTVNAAYVLAQHNSNTYKAQFEKLNDEVELVVTDMAKVVFNTA